VETDLNEPDFFVSPLLADGLTLQGTRTIIHTGTLSGVHSYDFSTSPITDGQITDAGLSGEWSDSGPGGSSLVQKMIVLTSGPNAGAVAWIQKDLGGKTARYSPFIFNFSRIEPAIGETYEIVTVTKLTGGPLWLNQTGLLTISDVDIDGDLASFQPGLLAQSNAFLQNCRIGGYGSRVRNGADVTIASCFFDTNPASFSAAHGTAFLFACFVRSQIQATQQGKITIGGDSTAQWDGQPNQIDLQVSASGFAEIQPTATWAVFDSPFSNGGAAFVRASGSLLIRGKVAGLGLSNGHGLWVDSGASAYWPQPDAAALHMDFSGAGIVETKIGGTVQTVAALGVAGFINPANNAKAVPVFYSPP
jgi:hypothetical protein